MSDKTRYGEPLKRFTGMMEKKLALPKNVAKPHWLGASLWDLYHDLRAEVIELLAAVKDGELGDVEHEAVDVANFAMIVADKARDMRRKKNVNMHPSITQDVVIAAVKEDDHRGFCIFCGQEAHGVEPDAREYTCESCGEPGVYGAEELLFHVS